MADMGEMFLSVEVDQTKVEAVRDAEDRLNVATQEMRDAVEAVRTATFDLRRSLSVKRKRVGD